MGIQTITVPVKVAANAAAKSYPLTVTLAGQVCTTKVCIPLKAPASFTVGVGPAMRPNGAPFPAFPAAGVVATPEGSGRPATAGAPATGGPSGPLDLTKQAQVTTPRTSWALILLFALLGGLIMNVMPCVLPVVPIKIYSFLEHSQQGGGRAMRLALAFAAGMIGVFLVLGAIMASARGLWGSQFQSPVFVTTLGGIMFAMALWLLGAFTLSLPQRIAGARLSSGDIAGSMGMGALATLLATPCSGPFLGGAIAWAAAQSAPLIMLTFATIGVGMALPYVVLVAQPSLLKRLPRPGPWMEIWKQSMALVMFGVTIYFLNLLPAESHVRFLIFCLAIGAGAWVLQAWGGLTATTGRRRAAWAAALALMIAGGVPAYQPLPARAALSGTAVTSGGLEWAPFDVPTLNKWAGSGETVVVEWTADWCPNCKLIENTVYRQASVIDRLRGKVKLMRADITHSFPAAESLLQKLGGQSIPFSAVFLKKDPTHPIILRDVYTAGDLLAALGPEA